MSVRPAAIAAALLLLAACAAPTEPTAAKPSNAIEMAAASSGALAPVSAQRAAEENCSFSRGVTTCVSTVQYTETSTHSEISGCSYGPSFPPAPGRRTRTFSDTWLVTVTTTTLRRGKSDRVFDSHTTTDRQLLTSTQTSDVCEPI